MYDSSFFQTKLGHASLASISAMVLFVALAAQMHASPVFALADADDRAVPVEMAKTAMKLELA